VVSQEKGVVTLKKETEVAINYSSTIISSCFIITAIVSKKYLG
jgi:hypothetical protein